jgi:type I restriction-modification system DNA methylase subunit
VLPDTTKNLEYRNSFTSNFNNETYDLIITNPPYGGDKNKKSNAQIKREKIRKYIDKEMQNLKDRVIIKMRNRQLKKLIEIDKLEKEEREKMKVTLDSSSDRIREFSKKYELTGNDKESVSLILMMDLVKVDGTVVGVLKEGVFFDKKYRKLRECLIKNFNVREVISIPQDQFENTSTKTSIVIFDNTTQKTTEVKFYELNVNRYDEDKFEEINDEIVLTESKADIMGISDNLVSSATSKEILNHRICSLNCKDYKMKKLKVGKDYKIVKLGDVCEFLPKSKRCASFGNKTGKYNFYTSSGTVQKCDIADYSGNCVIIGTGGNSCIHYADEKFSCSADTLILSTSKLNNKMIYYSIITRWAFYSKTKIV